MTCANFIGMLFLARDVAHSAHLNTRSYAKHIALNEFYDSLLELIDGFVEQYQGYYKTRMAIKREDGNDDDIRDLIDFRCEWIEMYRYQICDKDETALQNTIDEILRLYEHTQYTLTLQ